MGATLKADPDAMRTAAQNIVDAVDGMQSEIDGLTRLLDLLADQWSGDAAEAYRDAQQGWNSGMSDLKETLAHAASELNDGAGRYEAAEAAVVAVCT